MKIQEYKNKIIIGAVFLAIFIVVFTVLLRRDNLDNKEKSEEVKIREKVITELDPSKMSRISFFNATDDRVSLAVPEWWEGKYRLKESGDIATFSYIDKAGVSQEFFVIKKYPAASWQNDDPLREESKELKILKKKDTVYVYYLFPDERSEKEQESELIQMRREVDLVVKTMK